MNVSRYVTPPHFMKILSHAIGSMFLQFSSVVTPWTTAHLTSLFITNSQSLLKLMSIESVMLPNHLILCHPLLLLSSVFPSIRVFSNELALWIRWPKYWSFSFRVSPSNEYLGLVSFKIDWFDLLAVQGALESLFQHHYSKEPIVTIRIMGFEAMIETSSLSATSCA